MFEGVRNKGKHLQSLLWLDIEPAIMFLTSRVKAQEHDSSGLPREKNAFCTDTEFLPYNNYWISGFTRQYFKTLTT